MACIVIMGKENCLDAMHAMHVCEILSKHLPSFTFTFRTKDDADWPNWLDQTNSTYGWHQTKSPVIWKEIGQIGGKAYLIGGLGEFWEYCHDYYNFESKIPINDLERIRDDYQAANPKRSLSCVLTIAILGVSNLEMLHLILYEFQQCFSLHNGQTINVKLYDQIKVDDLDRQDLLLDMVDEMRDYVNFIPQCVCLVASSEEAIRDSDLVIIIEDYSRLPGEDISTWLDRCRAQMLILADDINLYAKRDVKVVLSHHGPVCFNASNLIKYCTTIRLANIVAVTADEGISVINLLAEKSNELVENFWCPPVWGFCGLESHVALSRTLLTTDVLRPFKRSLRMKEGSKLPLGIYQKEFRYLEDVVDVDERLCQAIDKRQDDQYEKLKRLPILPKVRALSSLLKLWFADKVGDEIISLGVCSNGTFGFPLGICVSQAVALTEKRIWEPVTNLPIDDNTQAKISSVSLQIESILAKFSLGEQFDGYGQFTASESFC